MVPQRPKQRQTSAFLQVEFHGSARAQLSDLAAASYRAVNSLKTRVLSSLFVLAPLASIHVTLRAQLPEIPPPVLPERATSALSASLEAARRYSHHIWRDTPPYGADNLVNGYIEIPRGGRRKWEFNMRAN